MCLKKEKYCDKYCINRKALRNNINEINKLNCF